MDGGDAVVMGIANGSCSFGKEEKYTPTASDFFFKRDK